MIPKSQEPTEDVAGVEGLEPPTQNWSQQQIEPFRSQASQSGVSAPTLGWRRSQNCFHRCPDAGGQRHGHRAPKGNAYCAHRHSCATGACGQPAEKCQEQQ